MCFVIEIFIVVWKEDILKLTRNVEIENINKYYGQIFLNLFNDQRTSSSQSESNTFQ